MSGHPDRHPELPLDPDSPSLPPAPPHLRPAAVALVAAGGFLGTAARYGAGRLHPTLAGHWPWATLTVNVLGAFLLGLLLEALTRLGPDTGWRQRARLLLGTGFLGSFTTYSAFAAETDLLVRADHPILALGYAATTLLLGTLAATLGVAAGSRVRRGTGTTP